MLDITNYGETNEVDKRINLNNMDQEPLIYIEVPYETANYPHFVVHKHAT